MKMCSTDNKSTKPEQKVFYGSGSRKKIGQTYFKLCQTYFKISPLYFFLAPGSDRECPDCGTGKVFRFHRKGIEG